MISTLLIANRGEIAVRIARSAHKMGIKTVAVYSDADQGALHVRACDEAIHIGASAATDSYLNPDALIKAAQQCAADAVHPGYGFLAENADFAQAVIDSGITWVGPGPEAMRKMGLKIDARQFAHKAQVPIIPGFDSSQDPAQLKAAANELGYPVMVKASAGGGGKGIRIVTAAENFDSALHEAAEESQRAFADRAMIVERYITQPRHIEVQIIGDQHGTVLHLGTRECSLQRRHQKVIEEAPASNLSTASSQAITDAALRLTQAINYHNAGTVEFVVDAQSEEFYFLEMNTRLQVEHPVTEAVTGLDLVELQLRVAAGEALAIRQQDITFEGHAIEARINAEDPGAQFMPQIGSIKALTVPPATRWDSGIEMGSHISPHYDSMLAKLIVHEQDRDLAIKSLTRSLEQLHLAGIATNQGFLHWLLQRPEVVAGTMTTRFIDDIDIPLQNPTEEILQCAATSWVANQADSALGPWSTGLRLTPHRHQRQVALHFADQTHIVDVGATKASLMSLDGDSIATTVQGATYNFQVIELDQWWRSQSNADAATADGALLAPFPGLIASIEVHVGQSVNDGDVLVVLEAMKMLHSLTANGNGVIESVDVQIGDSVETNKILLRFT